MEKPLLETVNLRYWRCLMLFLKTSLCIALFALYIILKVYNTNFTISICLIAPTTEAFPHDWVMWHMGVNRWFGAGRKISLVVYDGTVTITWRDLLNIKIRDGSCKIKKYVPLVLVRHSMQSTTYSFKQSILPMELFFLVFEFSTGKTEDGR